MKKVLLVILVAVLVAVVAVAFVACDNKTGGGSTNGGSGGEGTKPEGATFTVTFNADGELDLRFPTKKDTRSSSGRRTAKNRTIFPLP